MALVPRYPALSSLTLVPQPLSHTNEPLTISVRVDAPSYLWLQCRLDNLKGLYQNIAYARKERRIVHVDPILACTAQHPT